MIALHIGKVTGALVDTLAVAILVARMLPSLVHVCFAQSNAVTSIRFAFFFVQLVGFLGLTGIIVARLNGSA